MNDRIKGVDPNYTAELHCYNGAVATLEFYYGRFDKKSPHISNFVQRFFYSDMDQYDWDKIPSQIWFIKYKSYLHKKWTTIRNPKAPSPELQADLYDISELIKERRIMKEALESIVEWKLPPTGRFWDDEKKEPMSYETVYGFGWARDYIKAIAKEALKKINN